MLTRISTMLAALAALALFCAHAQRGPWPSDSFNPPEQRDLPGQFDYYTLVLSWSPTYCFAAEPGSDDAQCRRSDGMHYGFVLHGLWPQYERGYPESCPTRWRPFVPEPVIASIFDVMPSRRLIIHEYRLHGTCSGLQPGAYFALARQLFNHITIPQRYHNPYETQFVSPRELVGDFLRANPGLRPDMMTIACGGPGNRLRGVRICMTKDGRPRSCGQNESRARLCRASQMHVPPVRSVRRLHKSLGAQRQKRERSLPRPRVIESPR